MIYVDSISFYPGKMISPVARKHGHKWSHLFGDDVEELHRFAKGLGLRRSYFQDKPGFPHYDLTPVKRNMAILKGAEIKELVTFLREKRNGKNNNTK
jgi:hypothetical protein